MRTERLHVDGAMRGDSSAAAMVRRRARSSTGTRNVVLGLTGGASPPVGRETWGDTAVALPREIGLARFTDVLTGRSVAGETLALADVLHDLPVALLLTAADDATTSTAPHWVTRAS